MSNSPRRRGWQAERILSLLAGGDALTPKYLCQAVPCTPVTLRTYVGLLIVQGRVEQTGTGPRNTVVRRVPR